MKKVAIFITLLLALPVVMATDFEKERNDVRDANNADIDIVKVWSKVEGDKLAFYIKVAGNINPNYEYGVGMNDGDQANAVTVT
ncbi:MAG: hypothetical protein J7L80_02720, partial [Thermoplasmata archaeon]|nr:hypothetical protein [Thermoplasmata archaeon]